MTEEDKVTAKFEENMQQLLKRSYSPPAYSEDFRADLLGKLRDQQKAISVKRSSRRKIIAFACSLTAAAAVFAISVIPASGPFIQDKPAGAAHAQPTVMAQVSGDLEYRSEDGMWKKPKLSQSIELAANSELRAPKASGGATGVKFPNGNIMVMHPGSVINHNGNDFTMKNGSALFQVNKDSAIVAVHMPDKSCVNIEPGSRVFLKVKQDEKFADGGSPAPTVVVLKGKANATSNNVSNQLTPGNAYQLYDVAGSIIPSRSLTPVEEDKYSPLLNTHMANFEE